MTPEELVTLKATLKAALERYDDQQAKRAMKSKRAHWNPSALRIYLERLDEIIADVKAGATPLHAIMAGFTGTLRSACLRSLKLKEADATLPESREWHYVPASQRKAPKA